MLGLGLGTRELQATASAAVGQSLVPGADYRGTRRTGVGGAAHDAGGRPDACGQTATPSARQVTCQGRGGQPGNFAVVTSGTGQGESREGRQVTIQATINRPSYAPYQNMLQCCRRKGK